MGQKLSIRNEEKTIKLVASFKVPYPELGEGGKKAYFLHFFFSPLVQVKAPVFTHPGKIFRCLFKVLWVFVCSGTFQVCQGTKMLEFRSEMQYFCIIFSGCAGRCRFQHHRDTPDRRSFENSAENERGDQRGVAQRQVQVSLIKDQF